MTILPLSDWIKIQHSVYSKISYIRLGRYFSEISFENNSFAGICDLIVVGLPYVKPNFLGEYNLWGSYLKAKARGEANTGTRAVNSRRYQIPLLILCGILV